MKTRYIPQDSKEINKDGATIYTYTSKSNQPAAIAYIGKSAKPAWHYRFLTEDQREKKINELFENCARRNAFMQERASQRKEYKHDLEIGDILYASWGYDQTNVNFFQVTAKTEKTVTFGEIAQSIVEGSGGFMSEAVIARKDSFLDEKRFTRTVSPHGITFNETKGSYALHLSQWDGRPLYQSHYA